jgi:hypothetical protein
MSQALRKRIWNGTHDVFLLLDEQTEALRLVARLAVTVTALPANERSDSCTLRAVSPRISVLCCTSSMALHCMQAWSLLGKQSNLGS